ncbi:MAG: uroporphyrinogen decarboxylase family protein [Sedimentisphaerales bacterium]
MRKSGDMNSKELVLNAVAHKEPKVIPYTLYLSKSIYTKLENLWGSRTDWPCPQDDTIRILWDVECSDISLEGFKDMFGCEWKRERGGCTFINPPFSEPDATKTPKLSLLPDSDIELIKQTRSLYPDKFIFYQFTMTFGERLWALRGMQQVMMDYIIEPEFVHKELDILMEMHLAAIDKLLSLPIDGITIGDDFGSQKGLMISRQVFLEFFKPRYQIMYEKIRRAGLIVGHHSCGDNSELMKDFIDIGVDIFHPLQPEAMDIKKIKNEYGKYLTFRGGIGTQGAVISGTPQQACNEIREAVRILSKGGGYLLETAKPLPEETPMENVIAIIEEMTRVRNYEF